MTTASGFRPSSGSLHPIILATLILSWIFSSAFAGACIAAKWRIDGWQKRNLVLVAAWASLVAYNGLVSDQARWGLGSHANAIPADDFLLLFRLNWATTALWFVAMAVARTALVVQLIGLLCPMRAGRVYRAWIGLATFNIIWLAVCLLLVLCLPIAALWAAGGDTTAATAAGAQIARVTLASLVLNVVTDIACLVAPVAVVVRLHMPGRRKAGTLGYFACGLIACIASIARLVYGIIIFSAWSSDIEYINAEMILWSVAELTAVVICACFPLVPSLWRKPSARRQSETLSKQIRDGNFDGYVENIKQSLAMNLGPSTVNKTQPAMDDALSCEDMMGRRRHSPSLAESGQEGSTAK